MTKKIRLLLLLLCSFIVCAFDQVIKLWLVPLFGWKVWFNEGISFSIEIGGDVQLFVIALVLVVVGFMVIRTDQTYRSRLTFFAAILLLGGALGNFVDRIRLEGRVMDYIAVSLFPVFNFADVCISIGVGALILHVFRKERAQRLKE